MRAADLLLPPFLATMRPPSRPGRRFRPPQPDSRPWTSRTRCRSPPIPWATARSRARTFSLPLSRSSPPPTQVPGAPGDRSAAARRPRRHHRSGGGRCSRGGKGSTTLACRSSWLIPLPIYSVSCSVMRSNAGGVTSRARLLGSFPNFVVASPRPRCGSLY